MIRQFDLIMTQRKEIPIDDPLDILSEVITWITGGPSHVRLYMKGLHEDFDFWEVTYPKCRFGYMTELDEKYRGEFDIEIGRYKDLPFPLPKELSDKGIERMEKLEGSLYDLGELLFSQLFDELGIDHTDNSDPERFVCSSGVENIFRIMGFPFCPNHPLVSPEDIVHSKFYVKVIEKGGE